MESTSEPRDDGDGAEEPRAIAPGALPAASARRGQGPLSEGDARAVLDTVPDAILVIDGEGRIEACNPATARLFGYRQDELLGRNVRMLMPEPHHASHDDYLSRYRATGEARIIGIGREVEGLRKDGTGFPLRLSVGEVVDSERSRFVGVLHDLSRIKNLQEQFLQSQKMEAIGVLAGGIAHDFNNLLTSIRGSCEILLDAQGLEGSARRDAERIAAAADQATALTTRLLAFSRKQVTHPQAIDLNQAVRETRDIFMQLIGEDIRVEVDLAEGVVGTWVDPGRLSQLLLNLVVNARDAMRGGGTLTVRTQVRDLGPDDVLVLAPGRYACLEVADSGAGIPPELLGRIFEPFFTTKEPGRGTGLGLSTCLAIAREHQGELTVDSQVGSGTRFVVYLPLSTEVAEPRAAAAPAAVAQTSSTNNSILLVEDDALLRDLVTEVLERDGYKVLAASDPDDALARVAGSPARIDVAITDVVMPGMSGFALRDALAKLQPRIRVVYMSGYTDRVLADHGALRSEDTFIRKPFRNAELLRKVREALDA